MQGRRHYKNRKGGGYAPPFSHFVFLLFFFNVQFLKQIFFIVMY